MVLKGPNGSGKTSLLKTIAGILPPSEGRVLWYNNNIAEDYDSYLNDVQFISHKNAFNQNLTVKENLLFWANLSGSNSLINAAITFFNLSRVINTPYRILSAGWQRRVALSKLMIIPKKLWLLDEPFTNMDEKAIELLLGLIVSHYDNGGIAIISSHSDISLPYGIELNLSEYTGDRK